jgi:hypothetical protein
LEDEEDPSLSDIAEPMDIWDAVSAWRSLANKTTLDLGDVFRRLDLVPFVLIPKHVSDHHGSQEKLSLLTHLRQALEAFVFGVPFDSQGKLYPEIEAYLAELPKIGTSIVLTPGERGNVRPYSYSYARRIVREARERAGLPKHVTLIACRHGGMTELGDAELTEQGIMALSAHSTPDAARGYVKKTERQRLAAARKRRAWVEQEQTEAKSQNEAG